MVTRPRAKRPTDRGSVSSAEELFPYLKHKDWRLFFPWVKRPGREADHVVNMWSLASTLPRFLTVLN
jgi:hypothetical protein